MKNLVTKTALLLLVSASALAGQQGGGFGGGGFGGGIGNPNSRNSRIVTADQGIRNAQIRQDKDNVAVEKSTQHSINGKCDDEQSAWKIIAPSKTKHKNYDEALDLYNKAVDSFNTERNKRLANAQCEQLLTKALELLK